MVVNFMPQTYTNQVQRSYLFKPKGSIQGLNRLVSRPTDPINQSTCLQSDFTIDRCQITQRPLKLLLNNFLLRSELTFCHFAPTFSLFICSLCPLAIVIVWQHLLEGREDALFKLISKRFFPNDTTKMAKFVLISFKWVTRPLLSNKK